MGSIAIFRSVSLGALSLFLATACDPGDSPPEPTVQRASPRGSVAGDGLAALDSARPDRRLGSAFEDDPTRLLRLDDPGAPLPDGVESHGLAATPDGTGWSVAAGGLTVDGEALGLPWDAAWTLLFDLVPGESLGSRPGPVVRAGERFAVAFDADGWLDLRGGAGDERLQRCRPELKPGAPVTVSIAWDPARIPSARLTLDRLQRAIPLDAADVARARDLPLRIELFPDGLDARIEDVRLLARRVPSNELFRRTDMPLDPWEARPPLDDVLALPVRRLDAPELADWGVTDHLAVVDDRLVPAPGQWRQLDLLPGRVPTARTTHVTLALGDGRVLLFGSEARDTHIHPMRNTSDAWILDLVAGEWSPIDVEGPEPAPRCHQTAAYDPARGLVFYPGGFRNDLSPVHRYRDLWTLAVEDRTWIRLTPDEEPWPQLSDGIVFHRETTGDFYFSWHRRLCRWSPETGAIDGGIAMTLVDPDGNPLPDALVGGSPSTVYDPTTDRAYVIGGSTTRPDSIGPWEPGVDEGWFFTNRTWVLDPESATLRLVQSEAVFTPRVRGGTGRDPRTGRLLLYGGVRDQYSQRYDDLWAFDPEHEEWSEVRQAGAPGPRGGFYGMPFDPETERFVLTHGRSSPTRFHDDTWLLDHAPEAGGEGRWLFDRRGFPDHAHLVLDWAGAAGTGAEVTLRAGPTREELRSAGGPDTPAFGPEDRFVEVTVRLPAGPPEDGLRSIEFAAASPDAPGRWVRVGAPFAGES